MRGEERERMSCKSFIDESFFSLFSPVYMLEASDSGHPKN